MCGIAGLYNLQSTLAVCHDEIEAMLATMPYRGPDAQGVVVYNERTALGHLRLAILDLQPASNQPFEIDDGELSIVFNGEIFNYLELRVELEALGERFRTNSDTEVLLRAYRVWGPACVPRFNGMWAFAIYDRRRDALFCARDRFGIKPFNYTIHDGRFVFASEIKAILAVAPELAVADYASLSRVLRASVGARSESTCFRNIRRLLPAHTLTATRDGIKVERYWEYPTDKLEQLPYDDAADQLREFLIDAIRLRMRSDVPVALTLSGGIDSSAIACLLRTFYAGPFDTYTAAYAGEPYDESLSAAALASSLQMNANLVPAAPENFLETLRTIMWHLESPTCTPAIFPLWNICQVARRKVTVLLEGQGADELLAGYRINFIHAVLDRLRDHQYLGALREFSWAADTEGLVRAILLAGRSLNPPMFHRLFRTARGDEGVYDGPLRQGPERPENRRAIPLQESLLNASLIEQIEGNLVDLLHYGDAISMAHSLESRVPFLDHRLVEFCTRLPGRFKYRDGMGKAILRTAIRGDVPERILAERKKIGFLTPIARWFRERPEDTVYPILDSPECRNRGIFNRAHLDQAVQKHVSGRADLSPNIFRWILTELWFQTFIDARHGGSRSDQRATSSRTADSAELTASPTA